MTSLTDAILQAQKENVRKATDGILLQYESLAKNYGWQISGIGYSWNKEEGYKIFINLTDKKLFRWSTWKSYEKFTKLLPKEYSVQDQNTKLTYNIETRLTSEAKFL